MLLGGIIIEKEKLKNKSKKAKSKDSISKIIFKDNERFAEVFNKAIFKKNYLNFKDLTDEDTTEVSFVDGKAVQKYRDVIKKMNKGKTFAILGIENQTAIDYTLPLRVLFYDCINYFKQCDTINQQRKEKLKGDEFLCNFSKKDRLKPVITLVIYYGEKKWDGSKSLTDMLDIEDETIKELMPNFSLHIIDIRHLTAAEIESYSGSVKALFGFLAYDKNKKELINFIDKNADIFKNLPNDISMAINIFSKTKINAKNITETGGIDMCKAIEDLRREERNIGLRDGLEQGLEQGIRQTKEQIIKEMKKLGYSEEKIQELIERI